jgi:hypothetical protein
VSTAYQPLVESSSLLNAPDALRERMKATGYLFVRGLLPVDAVTQTCRDIFGVLARWEILDPDAPVEAGRMRPGDPPERGLLEQFHREINRLDSFETLAHTDALLNVMAALLEGPVLVHTRKICRVKYPNDPYDIVLPHQDFWYIKGDPVTYSCWIPLMPMGESVGGLAVAPGTHRLGALEHARPSHSRFSGVSDEAARREWHRSDYRPGDALIFLSYTLHQGLLNRSQQIRLSVDYRYQREDTPIDPSHFRPHMT